MLKAQSQAKYKVLEHSPNHAHDCVQGKTILPYQNFRGRGRGKPKAKG